MKRMTDTLARTLGRCPRCMRRSLALALGVWPLAIAASALLGGTAATLSLIALALGLTALWLAHIAAFARRAMGATLPRRDAGLHSPPRRAALVGFARALALAAAAGTFASAARAQNKCGCRVGDIYCDPNTHVTYECDDVQGCTMWILKGNAC
ncbi:MAG TPA: DUF3624 family protein [Stellaceae bacterium]|nr:DUF3624 family protein [Stellaceae bacterium]